MTLKHEFEGDYITLDTQASAEEPGFLGKQLDRVKNEIDKKNIKILAAKTVVSQGGASDTYNRGTGTGKGVDATSQ